MMLIQEERQLQGNKEAKEKKKRQAGYDVNIRRETTTRK